MIVFSIIRYTETNKHTWLYVFGASVGLGMLSKYSVAFYTVSVLAGILLTKHRTIFTNKHFWLAALVGFVIFLPNLIWQYTHHFPVLYHMRELRETQLQYVSPLSFLTDQIIMFLPCFFVWLTGLHYVLFSRNEKRFRFVGWAYLFVIIILLIGHGKNYYALGAYPVLLAFGAYNLERITTAQRRVWRYVMMVPVFCLVLSFCHS
jgi:4-amino-4-deoxy-L-arabinose transferase-like glycosyltransferase